MKRQLIWAAVAAAACANAFAGETPPVHGKWRITRIVQGPWATADSYLPSSAQLIGESVTFMRGEIVAPRPVGCWRATYTSYDAPVEEMFQSAGIGKDGAIALGVKGPTISSFSVSCSEDFMNTIASPHPRSWSELTIRSGPSTGRRERARRRVRPRASCSAFSNAISRALWNFRKTPSLKNANFSPTLS